ncbi:MAG: hypothetical protein AAF206_06720 [Bacteroidota bacterium]
MKKLRNLLRCFRPADLQHIQAYCQARYGEDASKRIQLIKLLQQHPLPSNSEMAETLYGPGNLSAFSKLKERLREDLLHFLNLIRPAGRVRSPILQAEVSCLTSLIQAKLLLHHDCLALATDLLQKTAQKARKYELPGISLAVQAVLQVGQANRPLPAAAYCKMVDRQLAQYAHLLKAQALSSQRKNIAGESQSILAQIKATPTQANGRVGFWVNMAVYSDTCRRKSYPEAFQQGLALLERLDKQADICETEDQADLYQSQAEIALQLGQEDQARELVEIGLSIPGSQLRERLAFLGFRIALDAGKQQAAHDIFEKYGQEQTSYIWQFAEACLAFGDKKHRACQQLIVRLPAAPDKEWQLNARILELMNIVESDDIDWMGFKLQNLRKSLYAFREEGAARYRLMFQVLSALYQQSLRPDSWPQQDDEHLGALWAKSGPIARRVLSPELIPFEKWLAEKAARTGQATQHQLSRHAI